MGKKEKNVEDENVKWALEKHMHVSRDFLLNKELAEIVHTTVEKRFLEEFLDYLDGLSTKSANCNVCGGLLPEFEISTHNPFRFFHFTCTKITDGTDNIIAETDYRKFGKYCQGHSKKRDSKKESDKNSTNDTSK